MTEPLRTTTRTKRHGQNAGDKQDRLKDETSQDPALHGGGGKRRPSLVSFPVAQSEDTMSIRDQLVQTVLKWEEMFGFFPGQAGVTAAVSEYDAAMILGLSEAQYARSVDGRSSVGRGYDFMFKDKRVQVKANRPSGLPGSAVRNAGPKVKTGPWDIFIYILYDKDYAVQEVYQFDPDMYETMFSNKEKLRLEDMRKGHRLSNVRPCEGWRDAH
jgi:hypothetical protein